MRFVDRALAARIEDLDALCTAETTRWYARLYPSSNAEVREVAGGTASCGGPDYMLNEVKGIGMHGTVSEEDLDSIEAFYHARQSPFTIELCPLADPGLLEQLARRGYRLVELSNTLVRELSADTFSTAPAEIEIREARPDEREPWVSVVAGGFCEGGEAPPALVSLCRASSYVGIARPFIALVDGRPAAGASLVIRDRIALMAGSATPPQFRRRGIHTAMFCARLAVARASGCEFAVMMAQPASTSQRNAERQGFRVVYTRPKLRLG